MLATVTSECFLCAHDSYFCLHLFHKGGEKTWSSSRNLMEMSGGEVEEVLF